MTCVHFNNYSLAQSARNVTLNICNIVLILQQHKCYIDHHNIDISYSEVLQLQTTGNGVKIKK